MSNDRVNSPAHYQLGFHSGKLEVRHVREMLLQKMVGFDPISIDYWSRAWEYLTRWMDKNGVEDLEKAKVYLNWLIDNEKNNAIIKANSVPTVHSQE
jgi:hypothetical protein